MEFRAETYYDATKRSTPEHFGAKTVFGCNFTDKQKEFLKELYKELYFDFVNTPFVIEFVIEMKLGGESHE